MSRSRSRSNSSISPNTAAATTSSSNGGSSSSSSFNNYFSSSNLHETSNNSQPHFGIGAYDDQDGGEEFDSVATRPSAPRSSSLSTANSDLFIDIDLPPRKSPSSHAATPHRSSLGSSLAEEVDDDNNNSTINNNNNISTVADGNNIDQQPSIDDGDQGDSLPLIHDFDHQYEPEEISTVDWLGDSMRDSVHRKRLKTKTGWIGTLARGLYGLQGWLLVFGVGIAMGCLAAAIDFGAEWATDLKTGFCKGQFWLGYEVCCQYQQALNEANANAAAACESWVSWSDLMRIGHGSKSAFVYNYFTYILIGVILASTSAWLVKCFAPQFAAGSGMPEIKTILGGVVMKKALGFWTLVIKSLGLTLAVGSGMSLGKEGPYVHLSCCLGNIISRVFPKYSKNEAKKRELLSAAAAAGVSTAFGAPVGGVLFSLEEASSYFPAKTMYRSFFCAVIAALVLRYWDPNHNKTIVMFQVKYNHHWHFFDLLPFAFIGVIGGLVGVIFIKANIWVVRKRRTTVIKKWPITEVVAIALITGIINYLNPFLRGSSTKLLKSLWEECKSNTASGTDICNLNFEWSTMLSLFFAGAIKLALAICTFGARIPAGLFIPSLCVGACFGHIVGSFIKFLYAQSPSAFFFAECQGEVFCVIPGVYSLVGAAATLAGVTRVTVSLAVIMFELTGGLEYVVPIMLAILIAKWVGDYFGKASIYEEHIRLNGYPFLDTKAEIDFIGTAADVIRMKRDGGSDKVIYITSRDNTIDSIVELLSTTTVKGFPVVNNARDMVVTGYITRQDLHEAITNAVKSGNVRFDTMCLFSSDGAGEYATLTRSHNNNNNNNNDHDGGHRDRDTGDGDEIELTPTSSSAFGSRDRASSSSSDHAAQRRQAAAQHTLHQRRDRYDNAIDLNEYLDEGPIQVLHTTPIDKIYDLFRSIGVRYVLVSRQGRLLGIITKKDVLEFLNNNDSNGDGADGSANRPRYVYSPLSGVAPRSGSGSSSTGSNVVARVAQALRQARFW